MSRFCCLAVAVFIEATGISDVSFETRSRATIVERDIYVYIKYLSH